MWAWLVGMAGGPVAGGPVAVECLAGFWQVLQNEPNAPWTLHAFSRLGGDGRPEQRAAAALAELDTAIKSDEPSEKKLEHLLDVLQNEHDGPWNLNAFSRLGGSGSPAQKAARAKLDAAMKSDEPSEEKLKHLLEVRACLAHLSAWFACAHASRHSSRHRGGHVLGVGLLSVTVD